MRCMPRGCARTAGRPINTQHADTQADTIELTCRSMQMSGIVNDDPRLDDGHGREAMMHGSPRTLNCPTCQSSMCELSNSFHVSPGCPRQPRFAGTTRCQNLQTCARSNAGGVDPRTGCRNNAATTMQNDFELSPSSGGTAGVQWICVAPIPSCH